MRILIIITVIILGFASCKNKSVKTFNPNNETPVFKEELSKKSTVLNVPDSLELIAEQNLIGDFNGDNETDFASLVKNKRNQKVGVIIIHISKDQESFVFGAGKEVDNMTDLNWIEIFKIIPKGEIVAPDLVHEETGDIIGPDQSQNFKLIGNGIYLSVKESHGGGIIFWNGNDYQWYHIE